MMNYQLYIIIPDDTIKTLPILGEEVQIVRVGGKKFYTRISTSGNPNISNDGLESYKEIFGNIVTHHRK